MSPVSLWEATIKYQLGKLPLPLPPNIYLPLQRKRHALASLPVREEAITHLASLPAIHKDPFDRLLICQAIHHTLTFITVDSDVLAYPNVTTLSQ